MDDGLKQRIIGAFVLLAIAVIFVPVFFDRERIEPVDRKTLIPPAPTVEPVVIDRPVPTETFVEPAKPAREVFVPVVEATPVPDVKPTAPEADTKPEITLTDNGVPQGWILQVASYQSADRATKMRDELVASGYKAYVREVRAGGVKLSRVYVGPKLDRSKLEKEKSELDAKYKIETLLLKFDP